VLIKLLIKVFLILPILSISLSDLQALEIREAYVLSEIGHQGHVDCQVSYDSAVGAVESSLRANRITVSRSHSTEPRFYININPLETSKNWCAVGYLLQVYVNQPAELELTGSPLRKVFVTHELCSISFLLHAPKMEVQQQLNNNLKGFVERCISRVSRIK
jgi:hypothetical protein